MTLIKGVLKESSFLVIGQIYFMGMNIILVMMLTRLLSVEDFGLYVYAQSVVFMLSVFGYMGLQGGITHFTAHHYGKGDISKVKGVIFGLGKDVLIFNIILAAVIFFVGYHYGDQLLKKEGVGVLVAILALTYPIRAVTAVINCFFQGLRMMRFVAILQNVSEPTLRLLLLSLLLIGSLSKIDYWMGGLVIIFFVNAIFALFLYRRYVPNRIQQSEAGTVNRKTVYDYALPLVFLNLSVMAFANLEVVMLGYFGTVEDIGVYRVYKLMAVSIVGVISAIAVAFYPTITSLIAEDNTIAVKKLYEDVSRWMMYVGLVGFLFLILYGALVGGLLFGDAYSTRDFGFLSMLALGILINAASGPHGMSLRAYGETRLLATISILALITLVAFGVVLIPNYGKVGAALAFLISQLIIHGLGAYILFHKQNLSSLNQKSMILLSTSIGTAVLILLVLTSGFNEYQYTVQGIAFSLFAILSLLILLEFLSVVPPDDRDMILKLPQQLLARIRKGEST